MEVIRILGKMKVNLFGGLLVVNFMFVVGFECIGFVV